MKFRYQVDGRKRTGETKAGGGASTFGPWFTLAGFVSEQHAKNFAGMLNLHKQSFDDFQVVEVPRE